MSEWKIVRLGDVLIQQDKSKIKAGEGIDDGVYPFYTCSNELTKQINSAQYKGPALIFGTGGKASVHFCSGSFSTSTDCLVYKTSKEVNLSLVNKYLRKNMYLLENGFKGAGLKHISREYIANIEISLPEILEQNKLDSQFDLIESSITNHKKMLEKYDTLIKSRFIEMFGDLVKNTKNWKIKNFTECAEIDTNMVKDFEKYADYPHIGIDSIEKETGILSGYRTVKEDNVISGKYLFTPEHIIYSKIRPNLNKVAMPNFEGLCSADAYPILVKKNIATREYLTYVMRSDFFVSYILAFSRRANMPKVNKEQVERFDLPVPPLDLQNQFASFVQQIDKSKFAVQKSLEKAETLYKSLMQEYFG